ncbi:stage III sporulation protein AE [Sporosalibacterium faouarense]|uniref:stage III sporulation protein AE n=1 Tax=Sporosalibacterium faouarense TaxID=516123 RepID=UPI00141D3707|nr:stage III sporulation protein AE [Sporosalibacterium faouarense]MTI48200.1 stage III sporulation protein AE [Bacillota bacterium]
MKKVFLIIVIVLIFLQNFIIFADDGGINSPIDQEEIAEKQLEYLKVEELQRLINKINEDSDEYLPKIDFRGYIIALIKGEEVIEGENIVNGLMKIIFKEVIANSTLLLQILVLAVICAVLTNLQSAFENDSVGQLAFYACYLILITISIKAFAITVEVGRQAINDMVIFIQALLPTLVTLLLAMGGFVSSALFQSLILGAVSVISTLIKDILFPLIFFSAVIGIVSKISDKVQISKISSLLRQIAVGILGVTLTIFIGIISIQGITAAKVDGITLKTAKFAVDKFVPIVGKFLSDAMDTVVGCSMLLKNAVGVIGLIALFIICVMPVIKITSIILIFKVTSAIIEPISNSRIVDCLNEISKSLIFIVGTVLAVGMMFFIAITIVVNAGNMTVMLR